MNLLLFNLIKLAVITEISFLIQFSKLHAMSQNKKLELDLEKLAEDSILSQVSPYLTVKMASSAIEAVSVYHNQIYQLELDLEKLAEE